MPRALPDRDPQRPWVIAHRGASGTHPENTMAAFAAAIAAKCDGIELDVQLSRDGVPVVFHDWDLALLGRPDLTLREVEADRLRTFDAGGHKNRDHSGERVPLLSQVLDQFGARTMLLIELKAHPDDRSPERVGRLVGSTIDTIRASGATRTMLLCFDLSVLALARRIDPDLPVVLNRAAPAPDAAAIRQLAAEVSAFSFDCSILDRAVVAAAHDHDRPVLAWTCNDQGAVDHALGCGVDGIMTDHPAWVRQQLSTF